MHFATHGFVDYERPELSGLVLSLVDRNGQPQEGYFRLHDIYNLKLSADLVVLSACNTGLGKEIKGEGLIGLTRGFMYAGAGGVAASLWKVDDEATAELMTRFYEGMFQEGLDTFRRPARGTDFGCGNRNAGGRPTFGRRLSFKADTIKLSRFSPNSPCAMAGDLGRPV